MRLIYRCFLTIALAMGTAGIAPATFAGAATAAALSQEKLDSLLAPIALYPDQLLTQVLMASTYPLDVVAAARFVQDNPDLQGDALDQAVLQKPWDPSVQSLTAFPQVLEMMNQKLEWTQDLGDAFLTDEKRVMRTVQGLRQIAEKQGNLKSTDQQKVIKQESTIIIEPAQPQVVYVPTYNPTVVYGTWWAPAYPPYYYPPPAYYYPPGSMFVAGVIGFGIGLAIADNHWGWCHADWHGGDIDIDINRNNTFVNNRAEFKTNVRNGSWQHNPAQRKGVAYRDNATRDKYRRSDAGAVSSRRDARGYERDGGAHAGTAGEARLDTRDIQTRDARRDQSSALGTSDRMQERGGIGDRQSGRSDAKPSFDASRSRDQARDFSNRGEASRSSMSGGSRSPGGRSGGGRHR